MKTNENFQLSTLNSQPNKRLAVVILNWNGRALMEEFLLSVVAYTHGEWADVIVADNGSTDDSIEMLKEKFPTVGIIQLDKNYGFAEGYNQALKQISYEYTVLLKRCRSYSRMVGATCCRDGCRQNHCRSPAQNTRPAE